MLFFGLFMVVEPRTAPAEPTTRAIYAVIVAAAAALLPLLYPTMALTLALAIANFAVVGRRFLPEIEEIAARRRGTRSGTRVSAGNARRTPTSSRWTAAPRIGIGFAILLMVGVVAAATSSRATTSNAFVGPPQGEA